MGTIKQINIKNWTYHFYIDIIDLENFDSTFLKIHKQSYKDILFTTLDILQLKRLMIVKIFTVSILSIYVWIMRVDTLKKKVLINT